MIAVENETVVAADTTAAIDDADVLVTIVSTMSESVVVVDVVVVDEPLDDDGHVLLPRFKPA